MNVFFRVDKWLRGISPFYLIIISIITVILISILVKYIFPLRTDITVNKSWIYQLVVGIVIAPYAETFIFQTIPIEIGRYIQMKFFNKMYSVINIILSSLMFALNHTYDIGYFVYAFLIGVIFSYVYIIRYSKNTFSSFATVYTLHLLINIIAFSERQF